MRKKERGFAFVPFLASYWQIMAIGLLVAAVGGYIYHCESSKIKSAEFLGGVQALGKQAEQDASDTIKDHIARKDKADAENKVVRAALATRTRELRDARARGSYVPAAAPGAKRPDLATYNRAELDGAIRRLDEGVQELIGEGDAARIDLDTAKQWIQDLPH